jgi:hypothetical protein
MGRPKIEQKNKKVSFSITISPDIKEKLKSISNRSNLIESLLKKYFEDEKINN